MDSLVEDLMNNLGVGYKFLFIVFTIITGLLVGRFVRFIMSRVVRKSAFKLNVDPTNYNFLKNAVSFLIFWGVVVTIFFTIPELKSIAVSLMASAGIFAAIIGFASQQAFSNIISGIFIVIFRPFRVDDYIRIGNLHYGIVEDITLRHTVIRNFENRRVIIPNSVISSETILNSSITDERICSQFEIGISYDANIDNAISVIQQIAAKHPSIIEKPDADDKTPLVQVRVVDLAEYSVKLRVYVWADNSSKAFVLKCDLLKSIKEGFDKEGIKIPYPHRSIIIEK